MPFKKRMGKQNICTGRQQKEETTDTRNSWISNKDRQRCYVLNKTFLYENCAWVTEVRMGPIFGGVAVIEKGLEVASEALF